MSEYKVPFPIKVEETRSSEDIEPTKEDLEMTKAKVRQPVQQGDGRVKLEDRKLLELIIKMAKTTAQTDTIGENLTIGEAVNELDNLLQTLQCTTKCILIKARMATIVNYLYQP